MQHPGWLTADVVEQLHQAVLIGRDMSVFINGFTTATMSGLIEYGCLRRSLPQLPSLPASITSSALGQSLSKVVSEIGLRTSGIRPSISTNHNPQEIEFLTVQGEAEATAEPMGMLYMRFTQAAKAAGFVTQT